MKCLLLVALCLAFTEGSKKVVIIGASGAIGRHLANEIIERRGAGTVIAAIHRSPLPSDVHESVIQESGISMQDQSTLEGLFRKYGSEIDAVWNLAAPLSVDTAKKPSIAYDVTVNGMRRLVAAMTAANLPSETKLLFSDSIGSFGASSPRIGATARWLVDNPKQDPGSDYGSQKRQCRNILAKAPFDTRWAVIPGVLHGDPKWGGGTTEYALEALRQAVTGSLYECHIGMDVKLPMVFMSDLTRGLFLLMEADRADLKEPTAGYAISGFSFTPQTLLGALKTVLPETEWDVREPTGAAAAFAELWPDTLDGSPAERDFGYTAEIGFSESLNIMFNAHEARRIAHLEKIKRNMAKKGIKEEL